jgi:hypothetical protein
LQTINSKTEFSLQLPALSVKLVGGYITPADCMSEQSWNYDAINQMQRQTIWRYFLASGMSWQVDVAASGN